MENARDAGDLYQGSVSDPLPEKKKVIPFSAQTEKEKFKVLEEPIMAVPATEKEEVFTPEKEISLPQESQPQQTYEKPQEQDISAESLISQNSREIHF